MPMVLGAGQMIPGFEEKLTGLKASGETTFKVPFPDDYAAKDLAGKEAEFAVTVKKVEEPKLPEVDTPCPGPARGQRGGFCLWFGC